MGLLSLNIKDEGKWVRITGFPVRQFRLDLRRLYRSSRIEKVFLLAFSIFGKGTILVQTKLIKRNKIQICLVSYYNN